MKIKTKFILMFGIIILLLFAIAGILVSLFYNNRVLLKRTQLWEQIIYSVARNNVLFSRVLRMNFMVIGFDDMSEPTLKSIVALETDLYEKFKELPALLKEADSLSGASYLESRLVKEKVSGLLEEYGFLLERLRYVRHIYRDGRKQEAQKVITIELAYKIDKIQRIFSQLQNIETDLYVKDMASLFFMSCFMNIRGSSLSSCLQSSLFQFFLSVLEIYSTANKTVTQFMYYLITDDAYDKINTLSLLDKEDEFLNKWEDRISVELEKESILLKGGDSLEESWKGELALQRGILQEWSELRDNIKKGLELQSSHSRVELKDSLRNKILPLIDGSLEYNFGKILQREKEENLGLFNDFIKSSSNFLRLLIVLFIIVFMAISVIVLKVLTSVLVSLRRLSLGIERIAAGDLDYEIQLKQRDEFTRLVVLFNAMTENLKNSRDKLIAEKTYSSNILASIKEGLVVINPKGVIMTVSPFFCNLLNYLEKEIIGHPLIGYVADAELFRKNILHNLESGFIEEIKELECIDKFGNNVLTSFSCSIIYGSDRRLAYLVCLFSDIREAKAIEKANLKNAKFQKIINSILTYSLRDIPIEELLMRCLTHMLAFPSLKAAGVFLLDHSGDLVLKAHIGLSDVFVRDNSRVEQGKGFLGGAVLSLEVIYGWVEAEDREAVYLQNPGAYYRYATPIVSAEKPLGLLCLFTEEQLNPQDQESVLFFFRMFSYTIAEVMKRKDSERELKNAYEQLKHLQSQLVQSEKMAAIGQLAGGVAHEINNPLTGVLNNAQLIKMMLADVKNFDLAQFRELLDIIEESALRCKNITSSLLEFSHASMGAFKDININELIEKVISLVQKELNLQNIIIEKYFGDNIPLIQADPQLLQQVIVSFISNAKWAIDKKFSGSGEGRIVLKTMISGGGKIIDIFVSDNGIGIPKDKISKIFEPFFTTKQIGEGTGLGLSVVYNIIKKHKGWISVESEENQGSVFKVSFPSA